MNDLMEDDLSGHSEFESGELTDASIEESDNLLSDIDEDGMGQDAEQRLSASPPGKPVATPQRRSASTPLSSRKQTLQRWPPILGYTRW